MDRREYLKHLSIKTPKKKKTNKYGNIKVTENGITFDSKGEYKRHAELELQQRAKIIKDLKRQVTFSLDVNGVHVCKYIADWSYTIVNGNIPVVEDFKGVEPKDFKIKKKLMLACHGINIWVNTKVNAHCEVEYPHKGD